MNPNVYTIDEFMSVFDTPDTQKIKICNTEIYDDDADPVVFEGLYKDIPAKYKGEYIWSVENLDGNTLNINISVNE